MKSIFTSLVLLFTFISFSQDLSDKAQIEVTLNNYIDGFYQGDTLKLKAALKPRLHKFGYLKDKETGDYNYYQALPYKKALALAQSLKDQGKLRTETEMRGVKVLEIANHIAAARVTGTWGIDYVLLSKDDGKWMIEQVIWEGPYLKEYKEDTTTTYYLIRHAEKDRSDKTNRNPHLTEKGLKRAENWATVLKDVKFDAVYSTDYNRTKETALPTAKSLGLELQFYDPRNMDMKQFMKDTKGKTVLIVGHSNTTPMFANGLLGDKKYDMMDDNNNGGLYIVTMTNTDVSSMLLQVD
ncbi:histidine phosphatase superfamily protein (branch 1) [Winogradskyella wandonensis]|uniref:Histidine phosphatase superfamily protein (Branch 1) n=1 Tax=Winogradskyella wandonensis TaxID=1442586 RepID=A0A4R1KIN9_9FLAO|nr:histidine phosphatase family protein [Winogradskyella wandonensis]TCK64685.1 histidine phosphatase superfamily protein (branch 1) [Winogradskyella wandonensis]